MFLTDLKDTAQTLSVGYTKFRTIR